MGSIPQTLKFTQMYSCSGQYVRQIISFINAKLKKKYTHLKFKIFQPSSVNCNDLPNIFFKIGSFVKNFPNRSAKPNNALMIVGLTYMNIGLSKYIVRPPKKVINIPPSKGTIGIFFSKIHTTIKAINVATINGGIAIIKFFSFL